MANGKVNLRIEDWLNEQLSKGQTSFSNEQVKKAFSELSDVAIKRSLARLSEKGHIVSMYKGYYLIIPPQYLSKGILPPALFIDGLMKYLQRPYYVGLLNAAALYGAAHQQPQEYFVFTTFPFLIPKKKKGIKINYISKAEIPEDLLEKKKTETGYINVSSPELTAIDLIQFDKRIGGLNRAAIVLNELAEAIVLDKINAVLLQRVPVAVLQRLGYLLDKVINKKEIATRLYEESMKLDLEFFRTPLRSSSDVKGYSTDDKWKIIVNTEIEVEE